MISSVEASLQEAANRFVRVAADRNPDGIAGCFAEDAIIMYPGWTLPVLSRTANREAWTSYFSRLDKHPVSVDSIVMSASGDLAYSFGRWATGELGEEGALAGRYVAVWRKAEHWEMVTLSAHVHEDIPPFSFPSPLP